MAKVIELYTCCICGVTNETCKHWGPICKRTGERVCAECCYRCEYRVSWSGLWKCDFVTPERKREEALERIRERERREITKASEAYYRQRRARTKRGKKR